MDELKQRILKDGVAKKEGGVVLVSSFLNHQLDPELMMHCAQEFARLFEGQGINKIVTIEASGIAPAILLGYIMHLPVVFVKKKIPKTVDDSWKSWVWSFTRNDETTVCIDRRFLTDKDRILFGNATGLGMPSLDPFHAMCMFHYMKHGFILFGMITVDTDVVRENNQTYRLGYSEMRKDGSKMGVGCPEYILLFRKLPTDTSRAYADDPVVKRIEDYSLARWQIDAHADWKSSGDRLLSYDDVRGLGIETVRAYFRKFGQEHIYNYEAHVRFAEDLEAVGKLPKTFMAVDPVSHKDYIWDDVTRMRTLNTRQSQKNRQNHICPLQLDICERIIERYSNKGDVVFDPFGGIQSVPYCAVKLGRKGLSTELNYNYWKDGLTYLREAEQEMLSPTLFDFIQETA